MTARKPARRSPLARLVAATRERARRTIGRGLGRALRWLPPQDAFLRDDRRIKLLRLGNQWGGKTTAGLSEVDWRCTGRHPFLEVRPPPIEAWIVCASWAQSISIQTKFWNLCSRDELDARTVFDEVKGFRGKSPVVRYRNGSIVRFKTTRQGGLQLASATIHVVLVDEPTEQRIFAELRKRLMRTAGTMLLTLTPINGPVDYLRELSDADAISDHHWPLRAESLIPVGSFEPLRLEDGTPMDQTWVDQIRAETLPHEEPIVVDGEWEVRVEGHTFKAFDPTIPGRHITDVVPPGDLLVCLGLDYGVKDFKQVASLVGVDLSGEFPAVHVLDERIGDGMTTPEQDAEAVLDMLDAWGWKWSDLHAATGDKPYDAGKGKGIGRKSNKEMMSALRKLLKKRGQINPRAKLHPEIQQAKTGKGGGRGSVDRGCTWLHRAMLRPGCFTIQPRCVRTIEALQKFAMQDDDWKDPIDAIRYATWKFAMRGSFSRVRTTTYLY